MNPSVPPEALPCPACQSVTYARASTDAVEVVRCQQCGKLLRRRRRLTDQQRGESLALRWAAEQFQTDPIVMMVRRRRKRQGTAEEAAAEALFAAAERLQEWARVVHKRPPLRERTP